MLRLCSLVEGEKPPCSSVKGEFKEQRVGRHKEESCHFLTVVDQGSLKSCGMVNCPKELGSSTKVERNAKKAGP